MSTLKVDNLLNAAGNESPISVPGAAKAWVNFNGTGASATIRDSFNVTSVTDNAIGDYTITLTNALGNSNYCLQVSANDDGTGSNMADGFAYGGWKRGANSTALTTSSARIQLGYPTNQTFYDLTHIMVTFFGN
jgi:hypothetical protein